MSEFEFLAVLVSIVFGLALTQLLSGAVRLFYEDRIDDVHLGWALVVAITLIIPSRCGKLGTRGFSRVDRATAADRTIGSLVHVFFDSLLCSGRASSLADLIGCDGEPPNKGCPLALLEFGWRIYLTPLAEFGDGSELRPVGRSRIR